MGNTEKKSSSTYRFLILFLPVLSIIGCSSRHEPAPVIDIKTTTPLNQRVKHSIEATEYLVKKGETLYSIAWRADLDVRTIASLNNIPAPYIIQPGQKLVLSANVAKSTQPSKNQAPNKKPNKNNQKPQKKPVAQDKKQEYGGIISGGQVDQNQKVRQWFWPSNGQVIEYYSTEKQGNKGINIAGLQGSEIKATADGKVVYAGDALRGYGRLVIVKHNDDYLSAYAHNDEILVKEQQVVKAGESIAKMGNTDAQRVMLHFEVRFRGKSVDPMKYLPKK